MVEEQINVEQNEEEIRKIVEDLTLFDDILMSKVFERNILATELLLSVILNRKISVLNVESQKTMKNHIVGKRSIVLDIYAIDENGEEFDVEVQNGSDGANVRRARFHSSMMDSRMLKTKEGFKKLKDSYVIVIYKKDKFRKGLPLYRLERCNLETMQPIDDGSHIIYVNGSYKGDDPIGRLVSDFRQYNADKMHYKELAEGVRHYKENAKGDSKMSSIVDDYAWKVARRYGKKVAESVTQSVTQTVTVQTRFDDVTKMMNKMKMTLEQAMDILEIKDNERQEIIELVNSSVSAQG